MTSACWANTPITFPIEWHNSKIPGFALRANVTPSARIQRVRGDVVGGGAVLPAPGGWGGRDGGANGAAVPHRSRREVQRDDAFSVSDSGQAQPVVQPELAIRFGRGGGIGPCYNPLSNDPNSACGATSTTLGGQPAVDLSSLDADEEFEAGLECNGVRATPGNPLPAACLASQYKSSQINIPAPGMGDNDHDPPRIDPRSLIDMSLGEDDLFHGDRYKWGAQVTAINVTDKYALYNFLSTFSGTHYVTPRAITGQVSLHF